MRTALLLGCLLSAPLAGQQELTTIGTFLDQDGAPVADAVITFATSPLVVYDTFAPATLVTATTDEHGRFRARLRTGVDHSAWAVGPRTDAGCARSRIREGVIAGDVVELRAATRTDLPGLVVSDLAGLGADGPFTARVRLDARHGPVLALPIAPDGTMALPPLPLANLRVRILDAAGRIRVGSARVVGQAVGFVAPREYRFVVRDEKGAPIAGARVAQIVSDTLGGGEDPFLERRQEDVLVESEPTDAEGRTRLVVRDLGQAFVAWAAGRAPTLGGVMGGHWIESGEIVAAARERTWPAELAFVLREAVTVRGRLHAGGAARGGGLLYRTQLRVEKRENGAVAATWTGFQRPVPCDGEGRFTIDVPALASGFHLGVAPRAPDEPPILDLPRAAPPAAELDLDLAAWPLVTLQLLDRGGGPPAAGRVVFLPADPRIPEPEALVLHADRAGRAVARLAPGGWLLFATDGEGYAARAVDVGPELADAPLDFRLAPLAVMSGKVVDQDGAPVPRAGFRFHGVTSSSRGGEEEALDLALRHHAMRLNNGLAGQVLSDADGVFTLRFVDVAGVQLTGVVVAPGSTSFALRAETGVELRLRE